MVACGHILYYMIAWIIVIALAGGWAYYNSGEFAFKPIIMVTTLPVPLSYLTSIDIWHKSFCQPGPGQHCTVCPVTDMSDEDMLRIVPQSEIDKFKGLVDMYLDGKPQFTKLKQFKRVDFGCCWNTEPWQYGYAIAESIDTWITWEMSTEELARSPPVFYMRIAGISKKHCLAPPIMPFGDVVMQGARSYATWPDHHHYWIHHFDAPHGRVPKDGVAVWDRSEQPWRPKVTYSLRRIARRLVNPLPVFTFNAKALQLAFMASGLKTSKPTSNVPNRALRDMIVDLRKTHQEVLNEFAQVKLEFTGLKVSQTNLQHILTPINHLAINNGYKAVHSMLSDMMHKTGIIPDTVSVALTRVLSSANLEEVPVFYATIVAMINENINNRIAQLIPLPGDAVQSDDTDLSSKVAEQTAITASLLTKVSDIQLRVEETGVKPEIAAQLHSLLDMKEAVASLEGVVENLRQRDVPTAALQEIESSLQLLERTQTDIQQLQAKIATLTEVHSQFSRYMVHWSAPYSSISSLIWTMMFLSDKHQLNVKWYTHVSTVKTLAYLEEGYEGPPDNLVEQDLTTLKQNPAWSSVLTEKVAIYEHGTRYVLSMFGPTEKNATIEELLDVNHPHHNTIFY